MESSTAQGSCPKCARLWQARYPEHLPISTPKHDQSVGDTAIPHPECKYFHAEPPTYPDLQRLEAFMTEGHARPIKALIAGSVPNEKPEVFSYDALMDYPHALVSYQPLIGSGVDRDPHRARLKACMEVIERFTLFMAPRCALYWGTADLLRNHLPLELPAQDGAPAWWCEVQHLQGRSKRLLRLDQIQWLELCHAGSRSATHAAVARDSTGFAVHTDMRSAVAGGLSECIERAGLATMWRIGPQFIWQRDSYPAEAATMARSCERLGYQCTALGQALAGRGYACMMLLTRLVNSAGEGPALVAGAGGGLESGQALEHAVNEAHGMLQHALDIWPVHANPIWPRSHEHFLFYFRFDNADRLWRALRIECLPEVDCPVNESLQSKNLICTQNFPDDIFIVDRGNQLTDYLGIQAVQVLVPGLERLDRRVPGPKGLPFPVG